jgi:dTDP-glucose pyrophosphorylase
MKVLVLMSGSSQSFDESGYKYPKNLVEINGKPLVQHVMDALLPLKKQGAQFICVIRHSENVLNHTGKVLKLIDPEATILEIPEETSGAACSALLAIDHINNQEPLIIANGDQIIHGINPETLIAKFKTPNWDAGVVVFEDVHPRWSFVKCNEQGLVTEAAEKRPISKFATAGFYYFARGADFVAAAMRMIKKDAHVKGLFYICPAINEVILQKGKVGTHLIARSNYTSLSTPADVKAYATLKTQET